MQLKGQIKSLDSAFKLKKVDTKSFKTLHGEYKNQYTECIKQRDIYNIQLGMWSGSLQAELKDLDRELRDLKRERARRRAEGLDPVRAVSESESVGAV